MYLKRQKAPKKWPIPRKGTTYVVRPKFNLTRGIPILIVLRDMLKITQNKKETKKAIYLKKILVGKKPVKDEKQSISLFDIITITDARYISGMAPPLYISYTGIVSYFASIISFVYYLRSKEQTKIKYSNKKH